MLRMGNPADAESIEKIRISGWRAAYKEFIPESYLSALDETSNVLSLRDRLSADCRDVSYAVYEQENELVGFGSFGVPRYESSRASVELRALYVDPKYWRIGIGKDILKYIVESCTKSDYKKLEVWCIKGNVAAETFYLTNGFLTTGFERQSTQLAGRALHELHYCKNLLVESVFSGTQPASKTRR